MYYKPTRLGPKDLGALFHRTPRTPSGPGLHLHKNASCIKRNLTCLKQIVCCIDDTFFIDDDKEKLDSRFFLLSVNNI